MLLLIGFSFLAGLVTILSPCILPILPIILSSSVDASGRGRPIGVVVGFISSFTFFTLFLSSIVRVSGISPDSVRYVSIGMLILFGLSLFVPILQKQTETFFGALTRFVPRSQNNKGFFGGIMIGFSIGLLWTPCVGPILASVISLALSGEVTAQAVILTLSYSLGTAIPMFMIISGGSTALQKVPWLVRHTSAIQKAFGVAMVLTAIGIYFNVDRRFQTYIITAFPQYGTGLTAFEDTKIIRDALKTVNQKPVDPSSIGAPMKPIEESKGPKATEIIPGGVWFNSVPLALSELRGNVVLIDFFTYSCINCQRTLPYLRQWHEKYEKDGLVIIGVHSPEFEFEKSEKNVAAALRDFKLTYPVVQDNDFATWRAYDNQYWPAKYLIDKDGLIRYTHFGEGKYDETEKMIQTLLREAGSTPDTTSVVREEGKNFAKTPEIYLGYDRFEYFSSNESITRDTKKAYTAPRKIPENTVAYSGTWTVRSQASEPAVGAKMMLNFSAKDVYLVMRPKGNAGTVRVYVDGKAQYLGTDVVDGVIAVDADRLYRIVELSKPGRHTVTLEFEGEAVEVFAFTFG